MSKRRAVWKSRSSTWAKEISFRGLLKMGSQTRADGRLELVRAGARRHPAGLHVQFGDALVVALEERQEVLRQVMLVAGRSGCR